ncbi:LacI family DNA-binding transcriptional regulator [Agromyces sp. CFH 90414]|uniref:LacI family DNA-binding transcriptional regulator n=1 Tax=Agromyces agglutinans TaxID=2662258 RepID=A0A6I2FA31_9MICO|nr:LacI family DNA-binding transcriptional regulator [Agromyces agglutinans]MRG61191.1 LacI family DNA-binding transcriptional regulator [Agromyces agglutinans]
MTERVKSATIADVAARAGVSQASVSRVLNGKSTVDPEIVRSVRRAVADLGYRPSLAARSLVQGRNQTVAMVVPDLENPLFQGILKGLSVAAAADGYRVLVADTVERVDEEEPTAIEARERCDAIVLCAPRLPADRLAKLTARVAPAVVVNRAVDGDAPVVGVDYARGIRDLVEHFASLGHRRLLYLAGPESSASNADRLRGVAEATAAHPGVEIRVAACGSRLDDGYAAADLVVSALREGVTGVLAFNDLVALGLLTRLRALGVDVPGAVSVSGFDDVPMAAFATPALTSLSVPRAELGAQVWSRLRALIAGEPAGHPVTYRPRLEVRESTGPAPVIA